MGTLSLTKEERIDNGEKMFSSETGVGKAGQLCLSEGLPGGSVGKNLPAMQETQVMQFQLKGPEVALEQGMATHASVLARRIPCTEEPGSYSKNWTLLK